MSAGEVGAFYRSAWPLDAKKAALRLVLKSSGELVHEDLLRLSGAEYARELRDPGDLSWAAQVHFVVAQRLKRDLSAAHLAALVYRFGGVAIETVRAAFAAKIRDVAVEELLCLYRNEIDHRLLLAVRCELDARGVKPKTGPSMVKIVVRARRAAT